MPKQADTQVEEQPVQVSRTKKINKKRQSPVQLVKGEKPYKITKPLLSHEEYRDLKSKRYNKYRKLVISHLKIDKFQVKAAVEALKKFEANKTSNDIFASEGFVYLEIVLANVPEEHSIRPVQVPLPTPIYSQAFNTRSAIFVSDPQRAYKDKIQDLSIPTVAKVIGYDKLKKKYKSLKDRRSLIYNYDLFFCDWRIYNLLRKPTGKLFYERKKIPFPIDCEGVPEHLKEKFGEDYAAYLNDLNNYTYFIAGNGPVYTVKVARTSMSLADSVKNIIHGIYNTVPHLLNKAVGAEHVRQISVKTTESPSLPIYCYLKSEEITAYSQ